MVNASSIWKNGGIGTNPQRQRQNRDGRESRIFSQRAQGVLDVAQQHFEDRQPAPLAIDFLCLLDAAELDQAPAAAPRRRSCLRGDFRRYAIGDDFPFPQ